MTHRYLEISPFLCRKAEESAKSRKECFRLQQPFGLCSAPVAVGTSESTWIIVAELGSVGGRMFAINSGDLNINCARAGSAAPASLSSFLLVQNPLPQKSIKDEQMRTPPLPASSSKPKTALLRFLPFKFKSKHRLVLSAHTRSACRQ